FHDGDAFKKLDEEMKSPTAVLAVYTDALEVKKEDKETGRPGDKETKKDETKKDETKKDETKKHEAPQFKKDVKAAVTLSFGSGEKDTVNVQRVLADGTTSRFVLPRSYLDRVTGGDIKLAFLDTS